MTHSKTKSHLEHTLIYLPGMLFHLYKLCGSSDFDCKGNNE